jgi:hypothetical protein
MANTFDPNKSYKWQPTDTFEISGHDFALILNSIRAILSTEEAQKIILVNEADKVVQNILGKGVEAGFVQENDEKSS